jgi:hypothetical protein
LCTSFRDKKVVSVFVRFHYFPSAEVLNCSFFLYEADTNRLEEAYKMEIQLLQLF